MNRIGWKAALLAWAPALLWAAGIFRLSAIPGDALPSLPGWWNADKLVHGIIFGVLGALGWRGVRATFGRGRSLTEQVIIAVACTTLFGISDELHQAFTPHRSPDVFDVIADAIGGSLGALVCVAIVARKRARAVPERHG